MLNDFKNYDSVDQWFRDKNSTETTYGRIEFWNAEKVANMCSLFSPLNRCLFMPLHRDNEKLENFTWKFEC